MAEKTGITWTDSTVNFWWGCTKVTDACDHCYAEEVAARFRGMSWGRGAPRILVKSAYSTLMKINRKAKKENRMAKVFMHSMSDIFDQEVPDEWREMVFNAMRETTNVYFQVLTKRPAMAKKYNYPAEKIWLGTSLGSDKDLRLAHQVVKAPALLHWISYEPAIGSLSIKYLPESIKWLVIGGESGSKSRPFHIEWASGIICEMSPLRVFMKQLGYKPFLNGKPYPISDSHGKILNEWPDELKVQEFPIE